METLGPSHPTAVLSSSTPASAAEGGAGSWTWHWPKPGFGLEDIRLLVCTHSHTDHYGLAAPIVEAAGCELWMHPAWEHVRPLANDPAAAFEYRLEVARESGVPPSVLEAYRERRSGDDESGIDAIIEPRSATFFQASRWRPTWAHGRCMRHPGTRPPMSCCTSRSAS